ncbi:hypothetical protein, partial [uncultured Bartonella sp.]|uniref:hypothetical protein n=1 Tax=uncultured Bartonella sp. TaxID=104108 RepID=UPI002602EE01
MTDNDRNAPRSGGQAPEGHDPLLELTRLFNLNSNANGDSRRPSDSVRPQNEQNTDRQPESRDFGNADLSFLETDLQDSLPGALQYQPIDKNTQTLNTGNQDFQPLKNEVSNRQPAQETGRSLNELYDSPSFIPQAHSSNIPSPTPSATSERQPEVSQYSQTGNNAPSSPVNPESGHPGVPPRKQPPQIFNLLPEQSDAEFYPLNPAEDFRKTTHPVSGQIEEQAKSAPVYQQPSPPASIPSNINQNEARTSLPREEFSENTERPLKQDHSHDFSFLADQLPDQDESGFYSQNPQQNLQQSAEQTS